MSSRQDGTNVLGSLIGTVLGLNSATRGNEDRVALSDIETQLRSIGSEAKGTLAASSANVIAMGALGMIALVGAAYLHGRRRGRRRASVLEIRRA